MMYAHVVVILVDLRGLVAPKLSFPGLGRMVWNYWFISYCTDGVNVTVLVLTQGTVGRHCTSWEL